MTLIQMFPELSNKTIWQFMPPALAQIVFNEIAIEREFGRPLPANAFYKGLAIKVVRRARQEFVNA